MRLRRGFTIVELLMVIAIIGILLGLTATAVTGAVRKGRAVQAEASVSLVNQGVEVYHVQKGEWPGSFQTEVDRDKDYHELTAEEVRLAVKALIDEARQGNPPMDISGLYVARKGSANNRTCLDFLSAIHGTKKSGRKMTSSEMEFGYPEEKSGHFRRFHAYYYPKTDQLTFTQ